ncbi:unnamed protein product [Trichobilharzia regenti]|nr:unnamed protein product [Trichobilharzia regenti]
MEQLNRPCEKIQRFEWMLEREYFVAITMGLLACFGLTGNLLSCIVIITHLLKFSGTFILFVFLSLADSLVVIMQTIDAYRNSVAVDFYTLISLEDLSHPSNVWRRDWNCKLFLYFWHLGLQLSAWLVMALSIDRYASLKQLNMLRSRSTLHYRAWLIGGGILIFLALVNLPFLIYVKSVIYEMPCGVSIFLLTFSFLLSSLLVINIIFYCLSMINRKLPSKLTPESKQNLVIYFFMFLTARQNISAELISFSSNHT